MPNVCAECIKHPYLKLFVQKEGSKIACSLCGEMRTAIDAENRKFFQLVKALIRINYSEWDYNQHFGGVGLEMLFYGDHNIFFESRWENDSEDYEEVACCIAQGEVYEKYEDGVTLFGGYDADGAQCMLLQSIKLDLDPTIVSIIQRLESSNHFHLESEMLEILRCYMPQASESVSLDQPLYRARVGFEKTERDDTFGFEAEFLYQPFSGSSIGAPPPYLASSGRANRAGVSFFYCATDYETSVSEIRPHPGEHVSIGKFFPKRQLSVYDLSGATVLSYFESDENLDKFKSLNTLSVFLNKIVPPAERKHYTATQLVVDCVRQLGFDGVVFNSTVGQGMNLVLFDSECVEEDSEGANVVLVKSLQYQLSAEKLTVPEPQT